MTTLTSVAAVAAQTLANMTKSSPILSTGSSETSKSGKTSSLHDINVSQKDPAKKHSSRALSIDSMISKNPQLFSSLTSETKTRQENITERGHSSNVVTTKENSTAKPIRIDGSITDSDMNDPMPTDDNSNECAGSYGVKTNWFSAGTIHTY